LRQALQANIDSYAYVNSEDYGSHIPQERNVTTDYSREAAKLDKGKSKAYWSTNLEKFARAFDAFVSNTLEEKAAKNTYLSHAGRADETVPKGEERTAINKAFRELIDEIKTRETDKGVEMYSRGSFGKQGKPLTKDELEQYARDLLGDSINRSVLDVVEKVSDLPFNAPEDARGVLRNGTMYLVTEQIALPEDAKEVVLHEFVGHFGLRGFFGSTLDSALLDIHENNPLVRQYAAEWKAANLDFQKQYGMTDEEYYYRSIEEAMAKMAQEDKPFTFAKRLLSSVQSLLRNISMNHLANSLEAKTNAEALTMLHKANLYIKKGMTNDKSRLPEPLYPFFMTAWHGSPHAFDRFSADKIGTGEGAQVYGYGLYFAGKKEVAEYYRTQLAGGDKHATVYINGISEQGIFNGAYPLQGQLTQDELLEGLAHISCYATIYKDVNKGVAEARELAEKLKDKGKQYAAADILFKTTRVTAMPPERKGRLYKVELAPKEDEYLFWDKPLGEQSEKVKELLLKSEYGRITDETDTQVKLRDQWYARRVFEDGEKLHKGDIPSSYKGSFIYDVFTADLGSQKAASEYLHGLGIRGIKYFDGSSRAKGEGAYNYVIFSDDDVEIKEQYSKREAAIQSNAGDEYFTTSFGEEDAALRYPSFDDFKKAFPGQFVKQTPDGAMVRTRGGHSLIIKGVDRIDVNSFALNIGYGKAQLSQKMIVDGKYLNGVVELNKNYADKITLSHESIHWMEDIGVLNSTDVAAVQGYIKRLVREGKFTPVNKDNIGGSEDRAIFLSKALNAEEAPKGFIGRIVARIQDFIDKIVNLFGLRTVRGIVRDIKTGKVYGKETNAQGGMAERYAINGEKYGKVRQFIHESITNAQKYGDEEIRKVNSKEVKDIKDATGYDVSNTTHKLIANDLRHILKSHGNPEIEGKRGQIAITPDDLDRIPDIIDNYDRIEAGSTNEDGVRSIRYIKRNNGEITYIEVIIKKGKVLSGKSMWKTPSGVVNAPSKTAPGNTSDRGTSASGIDNLTPDDENVNEKYSIRDRLEKLDKSVYPARKQEGPPVSKDQKVLMYLKDETDFSCNPLKKEYSEILKIQNGRTPVSCLFLFVA